MLWSYLHLTLRGTSDCMLSIIIKTYNRSCINKRKRRRKKGENREVNGKERQLEEEAEGGGGGGEEKERLESIPL